MRPVGTYPAELETLDLFTVWSTLSPLDDRFDPFSFPQRMAAYRMLIEATNRRRQFGDDNRRNPLWALVFQHHWQCESGRLGARAKRDGTIDPDAPWGFGNYSLCAIPWLGAVSSGLVPDLPLEAPPGPSRFDYEPDSFQAGIADWCRYFVASATAADAGDDEPVRLALWRAHKTCLDVVAHRLATIDSGSESSAELDFLRGWCRMVDYLWAAAWPTDFDFTVTHGLGVLPARLLEAGPERPDLPGRVGCNVATVIRLSRSPAWRHHVNLILWRRVMHSREARDDVLALLDAVFNPNPGNVAARRRLVRYLLRG